MRIAALVSFLAAPCAAQDAQPYAGQDTRAIAALSEDELAGLGATAGDFDMRAADKVLNRSVLNEAVVEHWQAKAADRRTIFFCATVDHADAVAEAFRTAGVTAETISGEMPSRTRAESTRP